MKLNIKELLSNLWGELDYGLRWLCYGLSPFGRFIAIIVFCVIFGIMSLYITISSIYDIGKNDAKKELLELEHIKQLEWKHTNDSINFIKQ
jgi:hypothetical protein